jgi:hypothetical protein
MDYEISIILRRVFYLEARLTANSQFNASHNVGHESFMDPAMKVLVYDIAH